MRSHKEVLKDLLDMKIKTTDFPYRSTIRGFLKNLLSTLWLEGEEFSGKRPFGNGGWQYDIYHPLVEHGYISGVFDEDGCIEDFDEGEARGLVLELIAEL